MGGVPVKHRSKSKVRQRRSLLKLEKKILRPCQNCNFLKPANAVCINCGFYRGKPVFDVLKKLNKKERKKKEKELEEAKQTATSQQ